jgi:hypothetical protein
LGYEYGILSSGARLTAIKPENEELKSRYVLSTNCPDPATMLRTVHGPNTPTARSSGEAHGYGILFAAWIDDETTFQKSGSLAGFR